MIDYSKLTAEDLLLDDSFLAYCRATNPQDMVVWNEILRLHPLLSAEASRAKELYNLLHISVSSEQKQESIVRLRHALETVQVKEDDISTPIIEMKPRYGWIGYAAAIAIIAIVISVAFFVFSRKTSTVPEYATLNYKETYHSTSFQRREVQLPDGSTALLNYGSTLKVADDYNQERRCLFLEGEGFFSVKKDASRPFIVITGKTATTALGTSFKVRGYVGEDSGSVMLATGSVKVQFLAASNNAAKEMILKPGEGAKWTENNGGSTFKFNMDDLNAWRTTSIVFEKANLARITEALNYYYGIHLNILNKPRISVAFTGKFHGKSLKEILEAIAFTNKFKYSQTGNIVSIEFQ